MRKNNFVCKEENDEMRARFFQFQREKACHREAVASGSCVARKLAKDTGS